MLRLSKSIVQAVIREAAASPDREVCGLVWASEALRTQTVRPVPNVHPQPDKYFRMAPRDVRRAFAELDEEGGTPLAWYHSHPSGKPDPSEEDMLGAMNVGMHYLIAYPEIQEVRSGDSHIPIRTDRHWQISAWECLEFGVLVQGEYEVGP